MVEPLTAGASSEGDEREDRTGGVRLYEATPLPCAGESLRYACGRTGASEDGPMHNDEPTLRDRLRRNALIEEVGEAIATCKPPQVFGVHGDWGLGKTSFLHQVRSYLTGDNPQNLDESDAGKKGVHKKRVQAVWFDAWRYHAEAVPVVALLQEMRAQLERKDFNDKRRREVAFRGTLLSLDELTKKIGFQYAKFHQASQQWDAENLAATLPSDSLRNNLQETIRLLLPEADKGESRLVVFVDDLDRCEPEAAYRLLEGLKVYLTLNNCVFVLGLNQKAVEGAIANRLADGLTEEKARQDAQALAASYLEKICQNVWHLPIVDAPGHLLCELVAGGGNGAKKHHAAWLWQVVGERQCLPPNPRKLKGLANLVVRLLARLPSHIQEGQDELGRDEVRALLVVAYIHQFHHDLYVRWQANPEDLYDAIGKWCRGAKPELDVLQALQLPVVAASADDAEDAEGPAVDQSTFPDPTAANVFWIQDVVRDLPADAGPAPFVRYMQAKFQ